MPAGAQRLAFHEEVLQSVKCFAPGVQVRFALVSHPRSVRRMGVAFRT